MLLDKTIMKAILVSILLSAMLLGCQTYEPFNSRKEFKTYNDLINTNFRLEKDYDHTIIYEISTSIREGVDYTDIQKRIDSLNTGAYNEMKFITFMRVDKLLHKHGWELTEKSTPDLEYKKINTIEELEAHLKTIDSILRTSLNIKMHSKVKP